MDINVEIKPDIKKQIELAAENLAHILIQQVMNKRKIQINNNIEKKYEQSN